MQWICWCKFLYCLLVFCHKNTCFNFIYFRSRNFNTDGWCSLSTDNFLSCGCSSHLFSEKETKKKTKPTKQEGKKNFVLFIITYNNFSFCCFFLNKHFLFFAKSLLIHQKSQKWAKLKVIFLCVSWSESVKPFHNFQSAEEMMVRTIILMTH